MASKFKFQAAFVAGGTVNTSQRRLDGVSVITEGPALGHGVMIDAESLETVKKCAEEYRGGLKVKVNHYTGADAIVGRLTGFRIDGAQLRADLELLKNHQMTPLILEMAETMPESFGLSISFSGFIEQGDDKSQMMRCLEIYSCDIVDQPAANPTGLFSVPFDTTTKPKPNPMTIETPEFLALQAEHKTTCELAATLKADLEAAQTSNTELSAKLTAAEIAQAETRAALEKATADFVAASEKHKADLTDFDAKVNLRAAELLAQTGANPVALGTGSASSDATVYDEFKAADPVKARQMYSDPTLKARIAAESARRMTASK